MRNKSSKLSIILKSFISFIFIIIFSISTVFAEDTFYDMEKRNYDNMDEVFYLGYNDFLNKIGYEDYTYVYAGWTRFRPYNNKLIIGASGVVHCGDTLGTLIDNYGYDIVSYGGICDDKLKEWIPHIHKKYKKIILFEGVNTVNLLALNNLDHMTTEAYESILTTIVDLSTNLLEPDGELVYVKVKPMTYSRDNEDKNFIKRFNSIANELNETLDALNIKTYEIPFETTNEYSSGYVHYNNIAVWNDMLRAQ